MCTGSWRSDIYCIMIALNRSVSSFHLYNITGFWCHCGLLLQRYLVDILRILYKTFHYALDRADRQNTIIHPKLVSYLDGLPYEQTMRWPFHPGFWCHAFSNICPASIYWNGFILYGCTFISTQYKYTVRCIVRCDTVSAGFVGILKSSLTLHFFVKRLKGLYW